MKRVLFITHSFPPLQEARSIQTIKIVRHMRTAGWNPVILTVDPDRTPIGQDKTLSGLIPEDLEIVRTPTFGPQWAISVLARTCPSLLYLPDRQIGWIPYAKAAATRLIEQGDFDLIYTNAKPFSSHLLGRDLKQRFDIPWVAYFSDPWVDSPYFGRKSDWQVARNVRIQQDVLESTDGLVYNNEETRDQMLDGYVQSARSKATVIPHCFDRDLFRRSARSSRKDACTVVHTGNFYGVRSPLPLIRAANKLRNTRDGRAFDILLVGKIDPEHERAIRSEGLDDHVRTVGSVSYLESLAYAKDADVLVSVDAPVDGSSVFFPSKLVDYLGAEKPVVGITPKGSTTDRILTGLGHFVADVRDQENVQSTLLSAAEADARAWEAPEAYDAPRVASSLGNHFNEVCERCASSS